VSSDGANAWPPVPPRHPRLEHPPIDFPAFARAFHSGPIVVQPADISVHLVPKTSKVLTERPRVEVVHKPTGRVVRMDMGDTYREVIANALQVLNGYLVIESEPGLYTDQTPT